MIASIKNFTKGKSVVTENSSVVASVAMEMLHTMTVVIVT